MILMRALMKQDNEEPETSQVLQMKEKVQLQQVHQHVHRSQPTVISIIHIPSTTGQDEEVLENLLPQGSVIISMMEYRVLIRSPIKDAQDWNTWLETFQRNTKTSWINRSCRKPGGHFTLNKDYLCHHSSHGKIKSSKKSCDCKASIKVRIKRDNKFTRCRDPHVKAGRLGIVKLNILHNHVIDEAALSYLPPSGTTRSTFEQYFLNGMKPVEASKHHMEFIKKSTADWKTALANASIYPHIRTVNWWYEVWKKAGISLPEPNIEIRETDEPVSLSEEGAVEPVQAITCDLSPQDELAAELMSKPKVEMSSSSSNSNYIPFSIILNKLVTLDNQFGTNQEDIRRLTETIDSIGSKSVWDEFVSQGFVGIHQELNEIRVAKSAQECVVKTEAETSNASQLRSANWESLRTSSSRVSTRNEIPPIPLKKSRLRKQSKFKDSSKIKRAKDI